MHHRNTILNHLVDGSTDEPTSRPQILDVDHYRDGVSPDVRVVIYGDELAPWFGLGKSL